MLLSKNGWQKVRNSLKFGHFSCPLSLEGVTTSAATSMLVLFIL